MAGNDGSPPPRLRSRASLHRKTMSTDTLTRGRHRPVFRFAPSPNGPLHLGHALSAGIGYRMAQASGGRFLLRIEDIDLTRTRSEHIEGIFRDLSWLGLSWEEPVLRQSSRFDAYATAARALLDAGLLYPCFATRSEIAAAANRGPGGRDPDGAPLYPAEILRPHADEAARRMELGVPHALRLDMGRAIEAARAKLGRWPMKFTEIGEDGLETVIEARPEIWGDAIIMRKETPASYSIAVVIDDAYQGVTHVTRGRDLFEATSLQRLLQALLDLPEPKYHHHRLVVDANGDKLAKSAGSQSIAELRDKGIEPEAVWRQLGMTNPAPMPPSPSDDRETAQEPPQC